MIVFIIGGTGVLSTDIVKECLSHGDTLYVLNRGRNRQDIEYGKNYHQIVCDIRNKDGVRQIIAGKRFDVVIDFLSYTPEQLSQTYEIFAPLCKQYIFISSCCVYRRSVVDGVITEQSYKPNTVLSYGLNKYNCEERLKQLAKDAQCKYTIVRPYITYGDTRIPFGLSPLERYHWTLIGRILADKPFFIWDGGTNRCSLLHSSDFAKIFHYILLNPKAYNEDVNLTNNTFVKWIDVLEIIYDYLKRSKNGIISIRKEEISQHLPEFKESLMGDRSLEAVFDITKLYDIVPESRQLLEESKTLREGIIQTIESYKLHNYYKGIDYRYDARVDRMLVKYVLKSQKDKIRFVDYLNYNKRRDIITYILYRYFPMWFIGIVRRLKKSNYSAPLLKISR